MDNKKDKIYEKYRIKKDLTGERFGKLLVLDFDYIDPVSFKSFWKCQCDCGRVISVSKSNLTGGISKSCGCSRATSNIKGKPGDIIGDYELIEFDHSSSSGAVFKIRCTKCGYEKLGTYSSMKNGHAIKCDNCGLPKNTIDMTGQKYGRLTVIDLDRERMLADRANKSNIDLYWICKCDCGNTVSIMGKSLRNGSTKSCGCLNSESTHRIKHGDYNTKFYNVYRHMKDRCYNPNNEFYSAYGGRGIKICDDWLGEDGYLHFKRDMFDTYQEGLSIDRIDVNGDYCKENCRWITILEQQRNKQNTIYLDYYGKTTIPDIAERFGMDRILISNRLRGGWTVDEALAIPNLAEIGIGKDNYLKDHKIITKPIMFDDEIMNGENNSAYIQDIVEEVINQLDMQDFIDD